MKVGVVTFHNAFNFGASLQAWALQKALRKLGVSPCLIHYHPPAIDRLYDPIKETNTILRFLKKMKLRLRHPNRLIRFERYTEFIASNFELLGDFSDYDSLVVKNLGLDAYIVGSDQVWNSHHIGGYDPAYFLEFAPAGKRRIAYAASIGKDYVLAKYRNDMKGALQQFTAVSVREQTVQELVAALAGRPVDVVLDPTLLLTLDEYEEIKRPCPRSEKYILVYMMEKSAQVIEFANRISRTLGLPIVQRRPDKLFANEIENCFTATPGEFLSLVENAQYVITNSFHGTVFSIVYNRPFVSMLHSNTGSRTSDMLAALDLEGHLLMSPSDFVDFEQFEMRDPDQTSTRLAELRDASVQFLRLSLGLDDELQRSLNEKDPLVDCPTGIRKSECYGCYACREVCPESAISMLDDAEGFKYPHVDRRLCTDCMLCKKICIRHHSRLNEPDKHFPVVEAAYHRNEPLRMESSSGAVFPELSRHVIESKGGVVVGVRYDKQMRAVSDVADNMQDVRRFYGSKYVKSDFEGMFPAILRFLKEGRTVLYSGLPCECAGLRAFLRKSHENLIVCEILCHAAPSPRVFEKYVAYLETKFKRRVTDVRFRDKSDGWLMHNASMVVGFDGGKPLKINLRKNNYYRSFSNDYSIRPCCTKCAYTGRNRVGDITIGDFWGIRDFFPEMFDNKGVSAVLLHNRKGAEIWKAVKDEFVCQQSNLKQVFAKNHKRPCPYKPERDELFRRLVNEEINALLESFNDLK